MKEFDRGRINPEGCDGIERFLRAAHSPEHPILDLNLPAALDHAMRPRVVVAVRSENDVNPPSSRDRLLQKPTGGECFVVRMRCEEQ
jgi:hypothetical protein